jgi:hypothetical protein
MLTSPLLLVLLAVLRRRRDGVAVGSGVRWVIAVVVVLGLRVGVLLVVFLVVVP